MKLRELELHEKSSVRPLRSPCGMSPPASSGLRPLACLCHLPHAFRLPFIAFCVLLGLSSCFTAALQGRAGRLPLRAFSGNSHDQALRYEHDHSAKWDPKNRQRTKSPEEAERILKVTGRLPRPLRLSQVKLGAPPLKKTIVATAKERRAAAEMTGIYSVSRCGPESTMRCRCRMKFKAICMKSHRKLGASRGRQVSLKLPEAPSKATLAPGASPCVGLREGDDLRQHGLGIHGARHLYERPFGAHGALEVQGRLPGGCRQGLRGRKAPQRSRFSGVSWP